MCLRYCAAALLALVPHALDAQARDTTSSRALVPAWVSPLVLPGGPADDAERVRRLAAGGGSDESLIRSTGVLSPELTGTGSARVRIAVLAPLVDYTRNSDVPYSVNDGALWAGRGSSVRLTGGLAATTGPLAVVIAPELTWTGNRVVYVTPVDDDGRSQFASPWYRTGYSIDLPLRFGTSPLRMVTLGQSRVELRGGGIAGGASTEDQWWGPGARNALVLSNNASGIPHLYLRTARPVRTAIGDVEARLINGALVESIYFDRDASNDLRSLSAAVATLRLAAEPGLTVGIARAVYAPASGAGGVTRNALDVLTHWRQPSDTGAVSDTSARFEQILSLFGRWAFPTSGVELYGEWARQQLPSLRDLLVSPQESQGYTLGMQVARPLRRGVIRGQVEVTTLEQTPRTRGGEVQSFYVSRYVAQGYTHRGQVVGAAIGPGSSSQWVAADYIAPRWRVGLNAGRIRWQEDAYFRQPSGIERHAHDVSLFAGIRAGVNVRGISAFAEATRMHRLNYLFQSATNGTARDDSFDVHNVTLRLGVTAAP